MSMNSGNQTCKIERGRIVPSLNVGLSKVLKVGKILYTLIVPGVDNKATLLRKRKLDWMRMHDDF